LAEIRQNEIANLFEQMYAAETFSASIITQLNEFRQNKEQFKWYDRSVLVSGITLSLLNYKKFDPKKVEALLEFLTDFEENVWQKALTGLYLGLYFHRNRLTRFQMESKLRRLQEIESVQNGLYALDVICKTRLYSEAVMPLSIYEDVFFTQNMSNCFLPFYPENEALTKAIQENVNEDIDANKVFEGMKKLPFIDAFKYRNMLRLSTIKTNKSNKPSEEVVEKAVNSLMFGRILAPYYNYVAELYAFQLYFPQQNKWDVLDKEISLASTDLDKIILDKAKAALINGEYYLSKGEWGTAIKYFEEAHNLNPNNPSILLNIGQCYANQKEYGRAISYYLKAETLQPDSNKLLNIIADTYFKLKQYESAITYYLKAESLKPEDINLLIGIANTYFILKQYKNAIAYYDKILAIQPEAIEALLDIADCYRELKQYSKALVYCDKAHDLEPNNAKIHYAYIAIYGYRCLEDYDKMYAHALKTVELEPKNAIYLRQIAKSLEGKGLFAEALEYAKQAEKIDREHKHTLLLIGRLLLIGNFDKKESKKYLDKCISLNSQDNVTLGNLGHWYLSEGQTSKAMEHYHQCVLLFDDIQEFSEMFLHDLQYLTQYGVTVAAYHQIKDELVAYWQQHKNK
jgi:tetratricopeptide (TPR) repeat protein